MLTLETRTLANREIFFQYQPPIYKQFLSLMFKISMITTWRTIKFSYLCDSTYLDSDSKRCTRVSLICWPIGGSVVHAEHSFESFFLNFSITSTTKQILIIGDELLLSALSLWQLDLTFSSYSQIRISLS